MNLETKLEGLSSAENCLKCLNFYSNKGTLNKSNQQQQRLQKTSASQNPNPQKSHPQKFTSMF